MVDLAENAFANNNFELATKLYEKSAREGGADCSLYLGLADSYARSGRLTESLNAYRLAFHLGDVHPNQLDHLITSLVDLMTGGGGDVLRPNRRKQKAMFTCEICKSLWRDPVTIPCGHTFCKKCLLNKQVQVCKICSYASKYTFSSLKCNVVLQNCIGKLFSAEVEAGKLKDKGDELFTEGNYKEAAAAFERAIVHDPSDHHLASKCCSAYVAAADFNKALHYAQLAVELRPGWFQGYQCLGNALVGLNLYSEATIAFAKCLALNPTALAIKKPLAQCLHKLLSSSPLQDACHSPPLYHITTDMPNIHSEVQHAGVSVILSELQNHCNIDHPEVHCQETVNKVKLTLRKELIRAQFSNLPQEFAGKMGCSKLLVISSSEPQTPCSPPEIKLWRSNSDTALYRSMSPVGPLCACSNDMCQLTCQIHRSATKQQKMKNQLISYSPISTEMLSPEDVECTLCYRLLYKPLTTPCGHVFCKPCLERSLDHSPNCPLCKSSLIQYIIERFHTVTVAIEEIVAEYFPTEAWQRKIQYENEIAELARMGQDEQHEIPIFVCTLAFPTISCPLHIFEPRYRLMIRQCIEAGTRQFGMCVCLESNEANFSSYGTMLEIHNVEYLPDGRSLLSTTGGRRFRVLSRGMRDGYHTARVEFLSDIQVPDEERNVVWGLHNLVHDEAESWFTSLLHIHHARIEQRFGAFPQVENDIFTETNGPTWCWWLIAVLPIDRRTQLMMLAMTSLKDRLLAIRRILASVRESEPH